MGSKSNAVVFSLGEFVLRGGEDEGDGGRRDGCNRQKVPKDLQMKWVFLMDVSCCATPVPGLLEQRCTCHFGGDGEV